MDSGTRQNGAARTVTRGEFLNLFSAVFLKTEVISVRVIVAALIAVLGVVVLVSG